MFRLNNDDHINLDSTLGSIASHAAAASKMRETPIVPFWIGTFDSLGAISNYLLYSLVA